jgi:hypothetical protein
MGARRRHHNVGVALDVESAVLTPVAEPDMEVGSGEPPGPSGPRIRCPLCDWSPAKNDLWACTCGHRWNTFTPHEARSLSVRCEMLDNGTSK